MIELKNLTCSYEKNIILKDVNLKIASHISILGANGSGKSTLARAMCSLIDYDGEIVIDGVDLKSLSNKTRAKTISYVPPKLELYDSFITLSEFVLLGRFAYKKSFFDYSSEDKEIADKYIKLLGLEHLRDHTLLSLSSGEQQLSLMASALCMQSSIMIFDEPTANLDPYNSKIVATYIKNLKRTHQIILITHDLHLASFIGSDVAFIKDKNVTFYGDEFFSDKVLEELYGVSFNSLAVDYE
ncbi:MAG TPA: ABC transporter ATP-binding protein [Sulfurimonas sp.]|uniref:ABC transporter ATP-binding protein n=1 Tax=Sulfurimonas sp. TaxID=2022749 RepID=UPI002D09B925|nr:ABC transporter ATP-binding protein [Sulfurimonas sp.]HUH43043.1 ABC transporter ATP-binding protein [Sulfurimonas sp.]